MAETIACHKCRRLFTDFAGRRLCYQCMRIDDELFEPVRDYVRNNPDATIFSTVEECHVTERQILEWLKEERLTYRNAEGSGLYCGRCGKGIPTGRFCPECKVAITREFAAMFREGEKSTEEKKPKGKSDRMRFLDKYN